MVVTGPSPYRVASIEQMEDPVETNDVSVCLYYKAYTPEAKPFIEKLTLELPSRHYHRRDRDEKGKLYIYGDSGVSNYNYFLKACVENEGYQIGDVFIPREQVVRIDRVITTYKKRLEIRK